MSIKEFDNYLFKDKYLGEYGFSIWLVPIGLVIFNLFLYIGVSAIIYRPPQGVENIIFFTVYICSIFLVLIWFSYQMIFSFKIIQEIKLSRQLIEFVFYFRRKIEFSPDDLTTVILEKNNFLLKKHRCIQTEKPCLKIITKDNKSYLITPHMERFDELTLALQEVIKNNAIN